LWSGLADDQEVTRDDLAVLDGVVFSGLELPAQAFSHLNDLGADEHSTGLSRRLEPSGSGDGHAAGLEQARSLDPPVVLTDMHSDPDLSPERLPHDGRELRGEGQGVVQHSAETDFSTVDRRDLPEGGRSDEYCPVTGLFVEPDPVPGCELAHPVEHALNPLGPVTNIHASHHLLGADDVCVDGDVGLGPQEFGLRARGAPMHSVCHDGSSFLVGEHPSENRLRQGQLVDRADQSASALVLSMLLHQPGLQCALVQREEVTEGRVPLHLHDRGREGAPHTIDHEGLAGLEQRVVDGLALRVAAAGAGSGDRLRQAHSLDAIFSWVLVRRVTSVDSPGVGHRPDHLADETILTGIGDPETSSVDTRLQLGGPLLEQLHEGQLHERVVNPPTLAVARPEHRQRLVHAPDQVVQREEVLRGLARRLAVFTRHVPTVQSGMSPANQLTVPPLVVVEEVGTAGELTKNVPGAAEVLPDEVVDHQLQRVCTEAHEPGATSDLSEVPRVSRGLHNRQRSAVVLVEGDPGTPQGPEGRSDTLRRHLGQVCGSRKLGRQSVDGWRNGRQDRTGVDAKLHTAADKQAEVAVGLDIPPHLVDDLEGARRGNARSGHVGLRGGGSG